MKVMLSGFKDIQLIIILPIAYNSISMYSVTLCSCPENQQKIRTKIRVSGLALIGEYYQFFKRFKRKKQKDRILKVL